MKPPISFFVHGEPKDQPPRSWLGGGWREKAAYQDLWESINGPGSWAKNPWVWVIDFRRIAQ